MTLLSAADFLADIDAWSDRILQQPERQHAIWGGASKGVTFALYMQRAGAPVDMVIDINPAKQNKYIAVTGLQVLSPDRAMESLSESANMFVMNSNYFDEIVRQSKNKYHYIKVDHHEF